MDFFDVMMNLAIGIAGGIVSSIIVSIAFYILTNFQKEINDAESLIYPVKVICVAWKHRELLKDTLDMNEIVQEHWRKILHGFNSYSVHAFDNELSAILNEIRDISLLSENIKNINNLNCENYVEQLSVQLELYNSYKKRFPIIYISRILKNKILWIVLIISIAIFIIA